MLSFDQEASSYVALDTTEYVPAYTNSGKKAKEAKYQVFHFVALKAGEVRVNKQGSYISAIIK